MIIISKMKIIAKRIIRLYYRVIVVQKVEKVGKNLKVNGKTIVTSKTILGNNVNFNGMKMSGGGSILIGNNFHSGEECMMITSVHNYDKGSAIPYDSTYIHKDIVIKDNVWIGNRVIILGGVVIGEGAIIQAGSVITTNIPDFSIAGGHPAKCFKYRDIEHYNLLKEHKKFH